MVSESKFQTFIVENDLDFQECVDVLYEVRKKELNRVVGDSVLESSSFLGQDIQFKLMACRESRTNKIIGCIRLTLASDVRHLKSTRKEYALENIPDSILSKLIIATRLAVLPAYRSSPAAILLTSQSFEYHIENGGLGMLGTCEPSLYPMYLKLGMRPLGPIQNSKKSGYRIPLIAFIDTAHFETVKNPGLRFLKKFNEEKYAKIQKWYYELQASKLSKIQIGLSEYIPKAEDEDLYSDITKGISNRGLRRLQRNSLKIQCKKGDTIIPKDDGGNFISIVYSGSVLIKKKDRILARLVRGDLFGELAIITGIYRTATVIAECDDTQVLILSKSAIKMPSLEDEIFIWKNLANIVAKKLLAMNN